MLQVKPIRTKDFSDRDMCTLFDFCSDCSVRGHQLGVISNSLAQYNKQTGQEELTSGEMEL